MNTIKKVLNHIFIDGLSGMALGLFATLIIGTIFSQLGTTLSFTRIGNLLFVVGKIASLLTGAGIGCAVACKFKSSPLVVVSAAVCGLVGAYASQILAGGIVDGNSFSIKAPGEPLGAFIGAYIGMLAGNLVSGKTKLDIILTPVVAIITGSAIGLLIGPPISSFMRELGALIEWATNQHPFIMGIVISVLMGMFLTLPISSAAIGVSLGLSGIAAGAATVGCCANMIGFAVASYRENKFGGLIAQGVGTSMIQMPNIVRRPLIWVPAIISSAILGPVSTMVCQMTNNPVGSGMGTAGLVGPIMSFQTMSQTMSPGIALGLNIVMYFVLPAIISLVVSEGMRKCKLISFGDMSLKQL